MQYFKSIIMIIIISLFVINFPQDANASPINKFNWNIGDYWKYNNITQWNSGGYHFALVNEYNMSIVKDISYSGYDAFIIYEKFHYSDGWDTGDGELCYDKFYISETTSYVTKNNLSILYEIQMIKDGQEWGYMPGWSGEYNKTIIQTNYTCFTHYKILYQFPVNVGKCWWNNYTKNSSGFYCWYDIPDTPINKSGFINSSNNISVMFNPYSNGTYHGYDYITIQRNPHQFTECMLSEKAGNPIRIKTCNGTWMDLIEGYYNSSNHKIVPEPPPPSLILLLLVILPLTYVLRRRK